ncbi:MAG: hypothetical protein FJZ01_17115 [Candidatus Sericytochromatia bacterium]|nr:hypothetical protein [Candidatus Tanganyikabacteria bacterium]
MNLPAAAGSARAALAAAALLGATALNVLLGGSLPAAASPAPPKLVPAPALLVGHLRVADLYCLDAVSHLPPDGSATPDGSPRWAADLLVRAASNLSEAKRTTRDPAEQERLEGLASEALAVRLELRTRSQGAALRVTRLRGEIRRFAAEVQRRIDLRHADPVPLSRPPLKP